MAGGANSLMEQVIEENDSIFWARSFDVLAGMSECEIARKHGRERRIR